MPEIGKWQIEGVPSPGQITLWTAQGIIGGDTGLAWSSLLKRLDILGDLSVLPASGAAPIRKGAVTLAAGEDNGASIAVAGRYAYVSIYTSPTRVVVVDISTPSAPARVGAVTLAVGEDSALSIAVAGRYAYVSTNTSPVRVVVLDISTPSAPTRIGAVTLALGEDNSRSIAVAGRYAYVSTFTSPARVIAVDIRGAEIGAAMIHSLEVGSLTVRDKATVGGLLAVNTGVNVGPGGIYSSGGVA